MYILPRYSFKTKLFIFLVSNLYDRSIVLNKGTNGKPAIIGVNALQKMVPKKLMSGKIPLTRL